MQKKLSLKESMLVSKNLKPMDIQFFAEPLGATGTDPLGGGDSNPSDPPATTPPDSEGKKTEKMFTQAQLAAAAASQVNALKQQHNQEIERVKAEALTEAKKLANMTAEEQANALNQQKIDEYEQRLAEVTKRELQAETFKSLTEKGLHPRLAELIDYDTAENVAAKISMLEEIFPELVREYGEKTVKARLAGNATLPGGGGGAGAKVAGSIGKRLAEQSAPVTKKANPYFKENN